MAQISDLKKLMNVGKATLADLQILGINSVAELAQADPDELYLRLQYLTAKAHDPCVWDVFAAIIEQARTGKAQPWWTYTPTRKARQTAGSFPVYQKTQSNVIAAYEKIAHWFVEHRDESLMEKPYLDRLIQAIPKAGSILDLGCGNGEPIARYCDARGLKITGIDGSQTMIAWCRERFPNQTWLIANMSTLALAQQFDAIIAWHSFFHLEHSVQRAMFERFANHLNPGGMLLFTSGTEFGESWSNNGGEELYHASLSTQEYRSLLSRHCFEIVLHKPVDPNCGNATIWLAQYRPSSVF